MKTVPLKSAAEAETTLRPEPAPRTMAWSLDGQVRKATRLQPGLHLVSTPIGNLRDITIRALDTLAAADVVLAEDTRVAHRLLSQYAIKVPVRRFDAHASEAAHEAVLADLKAGLAVALISDAGTPLLSDPGAGLVGRAARAGVPVWPVPGASALLAGLVSAGVAADRFFFEGFLPPKSGDRRRRIKSLEAVPGALVFYEAPHRVEETLADLLAVLGDRPAATAREITKLHETVVRGTLSLLLDGVRQIAPRGEYVIIVGAGSAEAAPAESDIDARLAAAMVTLSVKDAAAVVAAEVGLPRREVYARALRLAAR